MGKINTTDGTELYYKDWGTGQAVVFSHGWPLNSDAWESQMMFLSDHGYRTIAHDRRGHGRSSQPWNGNDMDTYADDLALLLETLDVKDAVLVGHSTGGGEVARYVARHGLNRVSKVVLLGSTTPLMQKTASNPIGLPKEVFDGIRAGVAADRAQFFKDFARPFYGANRDGTAISQGVLDTFYLLSMQVGVELSAVGRAQTVRCARVNFEDRVRDQFFAALSRGVDRHDLIVVAVNDQRGHGDFAEVCGLVGLGEDRHAVILVLQTALHAQQIKRV